MNRGQKCPFFTRRVGAYDWKGIKCISDKWKNGLTTGNLIKWDLEKRETHIKEFCNGDYKKCHQYKNHGGEND